MPNIPELNPKTPTDIRLDDIVNGYMIETGHQTNHHYARYLHLAIQGLKELNMDVSGMPVTVLLELNDNNTLNLPTDYIKYVKIGLVGSDGNVHSFGLNSE